MTVGRILHVLTLSLLSTSIAQAQTGWTVGGNGNIFKSTDGGSSWSGVFPTSALVNSVYFIDNMTGWVAGGQVILKTTTGGGTAGSWTDTYNGSGALNSVFFINATTGWAVGNTGVITKTTNGGGTWTDIFPVSATLNSVYFLDSMAGWVAGGQVILKTTTGGGTVGSWTDTYNGGGALNSVFFINATTGWAVGNTGVITKTTNGGGTWTDIFPVSTTLNSVYFIDSMTGWAAGGQVILKTTTGGGTVGSWTDKYTGGADIQSVYFLDALQGWAVGSNGTILTTTDGGETWVEEVHPTTATLESVIFVSPPTVAVTVNTSPSGRSFTVDGTPYSTSQTFNWVSGSSHTIATSSPQAGGAGTQYVWSNWSDGGAISHTVAPITATTYTANFTTQFMLTMSAGAGGSVSPASGFRNAGSVVSISATPNAGFAFSNWSGSGSGSYSGSNNPASVTMNGPISETGSFVAAVSVTVNTSPSGRSFTVDGTPYSTSQTFSWASGSSHTIATSSPQAGGAGTQYVWSNWSDGGAISHTVAPTTATTYTANFTTQFMLTMSAGAGGSVSPASGFRNAGSMVSISATPNAGFAFSNWSGSGSGSYSGSNNPASVTMNGPISETGSFAAAGVSVTVNTTPSGRSFSVDGTPYTTSQTFFWSSGSTHTIATPSPQAGSPGTQYAWSSWSDGGAISHTVAPTTGTTYTAAFGTQYYLTTSAGSGGTVGPSSAWRDSGVVVQITANADPGLVFYWLSGSGPGSYTGPDSTVAITMLGPISETGRFQQVTGVEPHFTPTVFLLGPSHPNPTDGKTALEFSLPRGGWTTLRVLDVQGRVMATLVDEYVPAGIYRREWNAHDQQGRSVATGIYIAMLRNGPDVRTRRMVVTR